ncbi:Transcriptional activator [Elasticomyces elasticus]|uniref:Transcriptional activator n=1 Tax=Exophiala sideris TaxID=1016849 RepID=A0ABR0J462_9EURO|nr:Transcriptional activator [Elasticomyces elasticus]KAK5026873.1 Transcriptional activator [Exophiala sideris]KAK5033877.1 Transcriptional activator [Exophiala sideris]KAK5055848.1 Transcriptional activator [Exophiala sideris]KAK5180819.1 Transcriptional activator [Eurotiomycetes sp. CCFEE 6388]
MQSTSGSDSRERRPSYDTPKRSALACNRCRGRKTKCKGTPPLRCPACVEAGAECTYTETERRIPVPESVLLDLQARAQAADQLVGSRQNSTASPATTEDGQIREDDDWWYKGMDTLLLSRSGEHRYVGTASSTYLAQKLNPTPDKNLAWDVHPMYKDPSSLQRPQNPVLPQLPPYEFAKRLYGAQYIYIGTIFSFLPPDIFEKRLQQAYSRPPDLMNREECLAYCQILLIFAYGQMYSVNQWSGNDGPPGFQYFKHALWLLPDIHQEGSILFVEVLSLIAPYMQNLNRKDAAFLYIGLAIRMAISLGLHQEVDDPLMDIAEREHRRRVWWSVYSMDRIISVKSGNPISIHDEDIDVAWPGPIPGIDSNLSPPRVLAHYTQLSRILGKIGEGIYRKKHKSGTNLLALVQSIMHDLSDWLSKIPAELRIDFTALDRPLSREGISTFLHYYQCINMTTRPMLLYVCQRRLQALATGIAPADWKEELSPNVVTIIETAIRAARASTLIMNAAAGQHLFATYGFMDGEHAFSATLTLVMVNVAFPYNEKDAAAMETALSVLRSMAAKGNEYIEARLSLLMNLRSSIGLRASPRPQNMPVSALSTSTQGSSMCNPYNTMTLPLDVPLQPVGNVLQFDNSFQPLQDVSFNFDIEEDPKFWEELSGNLDIDMDLNAGWIENALRNEAYHNAAL